jgi:hypothetical protein
MLVTRNASSSDAGLVALHRDAMFAEMGKCESSMLDAMQRNFVRWVERMLAAGNMSVGLFWTESGPSRQPVFSSSSDPRVRGTRRASIADTC